MHRNVKRLFRLITLREVGSVLFVFLVFFSVSYPLFHKGFFPTFDDVQVVRIDQMVKELKGGQFPVRYVDDFGNGGGYMFFQMYPPLGYYVAAVPNAIGVTLVKTTKLIFILGFALGILGMILLLRLFSDWLSAFIGMTLFITSPFLNYEIYTRGTLSEFFAFNLLPLVLWSFLKLKTSLGSIKDSILPGILYASIILTHTFPAVIISPFLFLIMLMPPFKKKVAITFCCALLMGLGLSIFFWLPLFLEQKYTIYSQTYFGTESYKTNFLTLLQIFQLEKIPWSFKPPIVGIPILIGLIIAVFILCKNSIKQKFLKNFMWLIVIGLLISLFFSLPLSEGIWSSIAFLRYFQFPWRFLIFITFFATIFITIALSQVKNIIVKICIGLLFLIVSLLYTFGYTRPATYTFISTYYAEDACSTTTWGNEYLPIWVTTCLPKSKIKGNYHTYPLVSSVHGRSTISKIKTLERNRNISFIVSGPMNKIIIGKYYFPGWQVTIDGKYTKIFPYGQYGLLSFTASSGMHTIHAILTDTPTRKIANSISGISLVFLLLLIVSLVVIRYKRKYENSN